MKKSCFIRCQLRLAAQHKAVASVSWPHSEVVQQLELGVALNALNAWSQGVLSTNGFLRGPPRELYSVSFIPWLCVDWHAIFNIFQYVLRWLWNIDQPMIRWSTYDQPLRRSPLSRFGDLNIMNPNPFSSAPAWSMSWLYWLKVAQCSECALSCWWEWLKRWQQRRWSQISHGKDTAIFWTGWHALAPWGVGSLQVYLLQSPHIEWCTTS